MTVLTDSSVALDTKLLEPKTACACFTDPELMSVTLEGSLLLETLVALSCSIDVLTLAGLLGFRARFIDAYKGAMTVR